MSDSPQNAPVSDSPTINWSRPKSPLPPHRLAKLANALGVSTPNPAVQVSYNRSSSYSASSPSLLEAWRSQTPPVPTPFSPGPHSASPTSSRYLLHVIPPLIIPHDSDTSNDNDASLAPPSSGYHRQFRRGTLVTLQPTLQSQLAVIAKEYALPSTAGLVLYLVSSAPVQGSIDVDSDGEPGPRLSDEIWKHLWIRVSRAEREESISIISRSPTPGGLVAASSFGPRTSSPDPVSGLRPFRTAAPGPQLPPFMPSPSTPSSVSDFRSHSKSSTMSSEPETPGTSLSSHPEEDNNNGSNNKESVSLAENMDLPGLTSPSVIPILAKVEFDIDRRKAVWFDPWVRSRKMNQAKRDGSAIKSSFPSSSAAKPPSSSSSKEEEEQDEGEGEGEKATDDVRKPPLPLALIDGEESAGYTRLKDLDSSSSLSSSSEYDENDNNDEDDDEKNDDDNNNNNHDNDDTSDDMQQTDDGNATARQTLVTPGKNPIDPLEDVFGTDADAWADIHADANSRLSSLGTAPIQALPNPHIVNLALTGADLSAERFANEEEEGEGGEGEAGDNDGNKAEEEEVEEVLEIMEKMGQKPKLSVNIPEQSSPLNKRKSTPVTAGTIKRHVPPPLSIPPMPDGLTAALEVSPLPDSAAAPTSAHSGTRLPYLAEDGRTPSSENMNPVNEQDLQKISEADLTIEFRPSPDEVKRGGGIYDDLDLGLGEYDENDPYDRRKSQYIMKAQLDEIEKHLAQFSPRVTNTELSMEQEQDSIYVSDGMLAPRPASNVVAKDDIVFPSTPKTPVDGSQWPAVPYSALVRNGDSSSSPSNSPPPKISAPSPPRLALNGISTSAPPAFQPSSRASADVASAETQYRMRHQQEQDGMYGLDVPSTGSPTLPLSPDPFSRMSTASMESTTPQARRTSGPFRDEPPRRQGSAPMDSISETGSMEEEVEEIGRYSRVISPTSRFSTDSITMEEPPPTAKSSKSGGGIMGMRNIKKLWRKSNKSSVSSTLAPPPPSSVASSSSEYATPSRTSSPSGSSMGPSPMRSQYMQPRRSEEPELYFDQETPYPIRRSQSSSKSSVNSSPPPSSSRPSLSTAPTPVPSRPASPSSDKEKGGNSVRKSILKSWKSASGSLKASSSNGQAGSVDAGRSSIDRSSMAPPDHQQPRSRRGSLAGLGRSGGGSKNSVVLAMADIPPSPRIPDQFVNNHEPLAAARARSSSLLSSMVNSAGTVGHRRPTHMGARPSISSYPSSQYTTSDTDARVSMASSSRSRDSSDTRPSFDTSQFEMVTPPRMMTASLSYPVGDDSITTSMGDH